MKTKRLFSGWVFLLMLLLVVTSCSEDAEEKARTPELPPAESLMMNFDVFIDDPAEESALKAAHSYQNAIYAYVSVSFWNVMITSRYPIRRP